MPRGFTSQTEKPTKSTTSQSLVQMFEAFGSAIGQIFYAPNLKEKAKGLKRFLELTGTYNEGFITSGTSYEEGLSAFFNEYLEGGG